MLRLIAGTATGLLALAGCASTTPEDGTQLFATADGTQVECRRIRELGTRLGKRVCMEPDEWAQVERAEKEAAEDFAQDVSASGINRSTLSDIN